MLVEVAKLSLPTMQAGIAQELVTADEMIGTLEFQNISPAIQVRYNAELSLGGANAVSASFIAPDGTVTPNTASWTSTTQDLSFTAESFNMNTSLGTPAVLAGNITAKTKLVAAAIGGALINATKAGNIQFNGLKVTVSGSATQDIAVATCGSGSFDFAAFDQAVAAVYPKPTLIVTNKAGKRFFLAALRKLTLPVDKVQLEGYGRPFLGYSDIPIVVTDHIHAEEAGTASYYFIYSNVADGIRLFGNDTDLVTYKGPISGVNSLSDNYTIGSGMGFVIPASLMVARVHGVTS
jgi:hypothetical protein